MTPLIDTWKAEAGGLLRVWGQSGLQGETLSQVKQKLQLVMVVHSSSARSRELDGEDQAFKADSDKGRSGHS